MPFSPRGWSLRSADLPPYKPPTQSPALTYRMVLALLPISLRASYAFSGTDMAYAVQSPVLTYRVLPAALPTSLRKCYGISAAALLESVPLGHRGQAYGPGTLLRASYAMSGTEIVRAAIILRARYGMYGTDL
eukprot:3941101-Rhodomonas_salina.1